MNVSLLISWPFSSRNLVGWKSSGFSHVLGSLCTDHRLGTITLPFGIVYPCSTFTLKHKDRRYLTGDKSKHEISSLTEDRIKCNNVPEFHCGQYAHITGQGCLCISSQIKLELEGMLTAKDQEGMGKPQSSYLSPWSYSTCCQNTGDSRYWQEAATGIPLKAMVAGPIFPPFLL